MEEEDLPHFPLRWESSSQQWWYATPIDLAAAAGHYDVVRALLAGDASLLIKLTSLRRIRRLETLWKHPEIPDLSRSRSTVAKLLLSESETSPGQNALIRAGYGGWLLYTAAAAGDLGFLIELLRRDPFPVFGEGEYGITDLLLAAARSGRSEVFRRLRESAIDASLRGEVCEEFEMEMAKRAVHCAAKGGNLEVLREVLEMEGDDVLEYYRDREGSSVLHSAAASGQLEVVKSLISSHNNIINATDHQGNTALHIAAYKGFFPVLHALLFASPSLRSSRNDDGNTILHMAVAGFRAPGFHHVDRQLELLKQLVSSEIADAQNLVNIRNNQGRTALQQAIADDVRFDAVDVLMKVQRMADFERFVRPSPGSSFCAPGEVSDKRRFVGNGEFECFVCRSPGSSFNVSDSEVFAFAGKSGGDCSDFGGVRSGGVSDERRFESFVHHSPGSSFNVPDSEIFTFAGKSGGDCSDFGSVRSSEVSDDEDRMSDVVLQPRKQVTSLRERFAGEGKRGNPIPSPRSPFSRLFFSSPTSFDRKLGVSLWSSGKSFDGDGQKCKTVGGGRSIFSRKLMSRYVCFRSQGLAVEDSIGCKRPGHLKRNSIV